MRLTKRVRDILDNYDGERPGAIHNGGGHGSIIGRNTFQRPRQDALALLDAIAGAYLEDVVR